MFSRSHTLSGELSLLHGSFLTVKKGNISFLAHIKNSKYDQDDVQNKKKVSQTKEHPLMQTPLRRYITQRQNTPDEIITVSTCVQK